MAPRCSNRCLLVVTLGLGLAALASRHMAVRKRRSQRRWSRRWSPRRLLHRTPCSVPMTRCTSPIDIGLKKIETLDAGSGAVLGTMEGPGLAKMLRLNGGSKGTALPGGGPGPAYRRAASVHRW